jgi:hypothetical protein
VGPPYALFSLLATIVLAAYHGFFTDEAPRSKLVVALVTLGAVVIWWRVPRFIVVALVLQAAICVYVLVRRRLAALP